VQGHAGPASSVGLTVQNRSPLRCNNLRPVATVNVMRRGMPQVSVPIPAWSRRRRGGAGSFSPASHVRAPRPGRTLHSHSVYLVNICWRISLDTSANSFCSRSSNGAHSVQPAAMSVSDNVCTKLPFAVDLLCATRSASMNPGGGLSQPSKVRTATLRQIAAEGGA
jgi:hypothetical protein